MAGDVELKHFDDSVAHDVESGMIPMIQAAMAEIQAAGEELTYDYRFHSDDERLPCNCGAALCRGFVNFKLQPQELLDANEVARVPAVQVQLLDAAQSKEALDEHIKVLAASDKRIVMMAMETEAKQRIQAE